MLSRSIILISTFVLAAIVSASELPLTFDGKPIQRSIGRHSYLLEDTNGQLTASEALRAPGWTACKSDVPNLAVSRSTHWIRFSVRNTSSQQYILLSIPYSEIDELDVSVIRNGELERIARTGRSISDEEVTESEHDFVFILPIAQGNTGDVLLRLRGFKAIHVPMDLTDSATYSTYSSGRNLALGAYAGIMMVMALYNLFLFFSIREKAYLLYPLYILSICIAQLAFQGVGPSDWFAQWPWLASRISMIGALLAVLFGMEFSRRFIGTKQILPRMHRIVDVFHILVLVILCIYLFGDPWVGYNLAQAICGVTAIFLFVTSISAIRRGSRQARFFLLAWSFFLLGVVLFVLKDAGVLPFSAMTHYSMTLGSAIEGVLLSFGLADRINVLRKEKERSQADALAASLENQRIVREQNVILEEKVTQRTHDLRETNENLKRTQTQLVNAEKMASLGQLTAGIAHEINNPINFITSNIQPLRRNISEIVEVMQEYRTLTPETAAGKLKVLKERERQLGINDSIEELDDIIGSIADGSHRTAEIVRGLRNFSRLDEDDLKESDLHEGLRNTLALLAPQYRDRVQVRFELGDVPHVECFPGKVNQVFMNILTNAIQATLARTDGDTPEVVIGTSVDDDHVRITISDTGIGMTPEVKARMFDPFFTTKPVGEGTGLGLAIVYGIVQDHFGHIAVDSSPGQGTTIRLHLPIRHAQPQQKRA